MDRETLEAQWGDDEFDDLRRRNAEAWIRRELNERGAEARIQLVGHINPPHEDSMAEVRIADFMIEPPILHILIVSEVFRGIVGAIAGELIERVILPEAFQLLERNARLRELHDEEIRRERFTPDVSTRGMPNAQTGPIGDIGGYTLAKWAREEAGPGS